MDKIDSPEDDFDERELLSLLVGAVLLAVLLLGFVGLSRSSLAQASNGWYAVDLYTDHHDGHHAYLPLVGR
jgi:hypothetical protein